MPLHKGLTVAECIEKGLKLLWTDEYPLNLWSPDASVEERNKRETALSPLLRESPPTTRLAAAESDRATYVAGMGQQISIHFPLLNLVA